MFILLGNLVDSGEQICETFAVNQNLCKSVSDKMLYCNLVAAKLVSYIHEQSQYILLVILFDVRFSRLL